MKLKLFLSLVALASAVVCLSLITPLAHAASAFVRPAELEHDVAFWRRLYTEVSTDGGFIHDNERPDMLQAGAAAT